jgi:curved DNA-binding protein CbpA
MTTTQQEAEYSFEVAPQVDITKLPLTPEEGLVVARILGRRVTALDLVREAVVAKDRAASILDSLVRKGAVLRLGGKPAAGGKDPYAGVVFSPVDLAEPADLTEEQRKRILFFEMHLDKWSYYKLLGCKRTSTPSEIKQQYFKSSKEFHPDAFFRKNLGSYRDRLDRIFRAMKSAYDTLSDPQKRAEYDATAVIELTPEEEVELERLAEKKRVEQQNRERDERNAQRMKEQRLKKNPMVERIKRAQDFMKLAEQAERLGKLDEAANHARVALGYDEGLKDRAARFILAAERARAQQMLKRIKQIVTSPTETQELREELNRVADQVADTAAQANDATLLAEVAAVLITLKRPVRAAKLAQQATELEPRNARGWESLAEAAHMDQKWAILGRAAERWLQLEPGAARAKELQKVAKKNT